MALTRGANSYAPCPVCLVPKEAMGDLSQLYPLRTPDLMKSIYQEAIKMKAGEAEKLLKPYGLRKVDVSGLRIYCLSASGPLLTTVVKNVFWKLAGCDIYRAISWDRLHAYHLGLFSDHLQDEMKRILEAIGGINAVAEVEEQ